MVRAEYLKKGDKIAIVGLAKKVDRAHIENAKKIFEAWGLEVVLGEHLYDSYFRFAATDEFRARDFQQALDDSGIKAIISARGGYGSIRILDRIDWGRFIDNPKWIIGFSDITAVLGHVSRLHIESIHGTMPAFFHLPNAEVSIDALRRVLFGESLQLDFPNVELNRQGSAVGILIGGNLSILCSIMGSASDFDYKEKILFIEEIDEYLYHIDRMLLQLKRAGKFQTLKGVVVGHFTDMKDNEGDFYGKSVNEIILEHFADYNIPIAFNLPVGHDAVNYPLVFGRSYTLEVKKDGSSLFFES